METNFVCCICHKIPCNVVESECCNSLFCWDCVVSPNHANKQCPSCMGQLDPAYCTENLAVKKIIDGIEVSCCFPGCPQKMIVAERRAHEASCQFHPILCPNSELCGILDRSKLAGHLVSCQYRSIQCHKCEIPLVLCNLQDHLDNDCQEILTECPNHCNTRSARKNIAKHIAKECAYTETECPFAPYGCSAKPLRGQVELHISEDISYHIRLISSAFNAQQVQINTLREQLAMTQEAASTQFPPNTGLLYQIDQELTQTVNRVRNTLIWNHPITRWFRTASTLASITVMLMLVIALFRIVHYVTSPPTFYYPPSFMFCFLGLVKWVLGVRLGFLLFKKSRDYLHSLQREFRKFLLIGICIFVFVFIRPLMWILFM